MKNEDEEQSAELLRQMGRLAVPSLPPDREASRHDRMASSVNMLLHRLSTEPRPRRLPVRALGAAAAVAASVGLWFGAHRLTHVPERPPTATTGDIARVVSVSGEATLVRVGSLPSALVVDQQVRATDELRSGIGARAALALTGAGKAKVDVAEDTRLRLSQHLVLAAGANEDWLELERGFVTLQVAKLAPGLGLSVQTPDARVTVHGTRFSVRVSPRTPSGTVTSVAVSEGRVEVDSPGHVVFLGPGDQWSSQGSAAESQTAPSSSGGRANADLELTLHAGAPPSPSQSSPRATRGGNSTLAEENQIYTRALTHVGSGELPSALSDLATLIQRYPRSPLAQNARVERFRLLQQSGNGLAAAQEARRYLSEYPNGFARDEARSLALAFIKTPE